MAAQRRDPNSLLNWLERAIRRRRESPEISWGDWQVLDLPEPGVLAMRYEREGSTLLVLHNFGTKPRVVRVTAAAAGHERLVDLLESHDSQADDGGRHVIELEPYAYRWFRAGGLYHGAAP